MTPREAVQLTGYIQAHFPSQPINEYTPDALGELLEPYPLADCRAAVLQLVSSGEKWCAPSDVAGQVKRTRGKRISEAGTLCPPAGLTEPEEREWLGQARRRIADGEPVGEVLTLSQTYPKRDVVAELGQLGQEVPRR